MGGRQHVTGHVGGRCGATRLPWREARLGDWPGRPSVLWTPCATRVQILGGGLRRLTEDSLLLISKLTTKPQGPKQGGAGQGQTRRPVDQTGSPGINPHTCGQMVSTRALRPFSGEGSLSNKWR